MARRDMARCEQKLMEFTRETNPHENYIFYDQFSGAFFHAPKATILAAESCINRDLAFEGIAFLETFYNIVGVDTTTLGFNRDYGWLTEGEDGTFLQWVDFDHIFVDQNIAGPCYHLITMIPEPIEF